MSTKPRQARPTSTRKLAPKAKTRRSVTRKPAVTKQKPTSPSPAAGSKQAQLIAHLCEPAGMTIEAMTKLTGWQPHTVRGTISGVLRKRMGLEVACSASATGGPKVYRIVTGAA